MSFLSLTAEDREAMLAAIGVDTVEELFRDIPAGVRYERPLDVPPALSEAELTRHLEQLAARNVIDDVSFLGAGIYDHYVPAVVDAVLQRGEFLTAYTPYQPELSQGVLQAIFEYQTAICELTGMDVSNASGYDGTTVAADACYVAKAATGRSRIVITEATNPQVRQVVKTFAHGFGLEIVEVPHEGGVTDPERVREVSADAAAVIFQQPNFFGCLEDAPALAAVANESGALPIAHVDLISLGVLEAPGNYGCALAIGEGQSAGNFMSYGGPHYGFLAAREPYVRRLPGRIVGETVDTAGDRGYVLTLQTREQHIRREKATSNITTNQTLLALAGLVHLSLLGPEGLRETGETCMALAAYAKTRLEERGVKLLFPDQTTFKEFAVDAGRSAPDAIKAARAHGVNPGYALGRDYPGLDAGPARRGDREAHDRGDRPAGRRPRGRGRSQPVKLIYEKSRAGRRGLAVPRPDLPVPAIPEALARKAPPRLPELAEPEVLRHFTELSSRNFGVDTGFYPLGSCTMKYNPRVNERLVGLPGFRDLHPLADDDSAQGALELQWHLEGILREVTGLDAISLQPAAGSQGELTGLLVMRAHFESKRRRGDADAHRHPGHRARNEPGERDDGRLPGHGRPHGRPRQHRPRRPPREGRPEHRRPDAHEPLDARALRRAHRADPRHLPRRGRAHVLRRGEPERRLRHLAARRHGFRHRPHQPAQDVLAAARRRRARRRADRRPRLACRLPAASGRRSRGRPLPARLRPAALDRQGARVRRAHSGSSCARMRSCGRGAPACAR